jgi:hypothetical protein
MKNECIRSPLQISTSAALFLDFFLFLSISAEPKLHLILRYNWFFDMRGSLLDPNAVKIPLFVLFVVHIWGPVKTDDPVSTQYRVEICSSDQSSGSVAEVMSVAPWCSNIFYTRVRVLVQVVDFGSQHTGQLFPCKRSREYIHGLKGTRLFLEACANQLKTVRNSGPLTVLPYWRYYRPMVINRANNGASRTEDFRCSCSWPQS